MEFNRRLIRQRAVLKFLSIRICKVFIIIIDIVKKV